ncbi:Hypothetical protein SRAE_2000386100 [Strongyloides ratti]|uniref:Uncharacterized protein n=1 Tax=Strongyloides ratti TaxID=34506 RepID=A0A090LHG7_STRRB|nr:Hypothetical protein SRAE_2000386100 [Strongyloides ratti]CEF69211.1 Hypothetical protein SRAE_2000386100 [Strongyloides ratti]
MKNIQFIFIIFIYLFATIICVPWDYQASNTNRNNPGWYPMQNQGSSQFQNPYNGRNVAAYPENLSVNMMPTNNSPGVRKSSSVNGYYGNSNINSQQLLTNTQDNDSRKNFSEIYFPLLARREKLAKSLKSKNYTHTIFKKETTPKMVTYSKKNIKNYFSTTIKPRSSNNYENKLETKKVNTDNKFVKINKGTKVVKSSIKPYFGHWNFRTTTTEPTTTTTEIKTTKKLDYKFNNKRVKSWYRTKPTTTTTEVFVTSTTTTKPILIPKWTKKSFIPRFKLTTKLNNTTIQIPTTTTTTNVPSTTIIVEIPKSTTTTEVPQTSTTTTQSPSTTTETVASTTTTNFVETSAFTPTIKSASDTEIKSTLKNMVEKNEVPSIITEKQIIETSTKIPTISTTIIPITTTTEEEKVSTTTTVPITTTETLLTSSTTTIKHSSTSRKSLSEKIKEEASKKYQYRNEKPISPYNFRTVMPLNSRIFKKSTSEAPKLVSESINYETPISSSQPPSTTLSTTTSTKSESEDSMTTEISEEQLKEALDKILILKIITHKIQDNKNKIIEPNVELLSAIKDVVSKFRQSLDNAGIQDDVRHMGNQIESTLGELKSGLNRSWFAVKQSAENAVKSAAIEKITKKTFKEKKEEISEDNETFEEESKNEYFIPNSSNLINRQKNKIENNSLYKKIDPKNKNNQSSVLKLPQESEGELQRRLYHKLDNWLGQAQQALSDDSGRIHSPSSTTSLRNHPDARTRFPRKVGENTSQI